MVTETTTWFIIFCVIVVSSVLIVGVFSIGMKLFKLSKTNTNTVRSLHRNIIDSPDNLAFLSDTLRLRGNELIGKSSFRMGANKVEFSPANIIDSTREINIKLSKVNEHINILKSESIKYENSVINSHNQRILQQEILKKISYKLDKKLYEMEQLKLAKSNLHGYAIENKNMLAHYVVIKDTLNRKSNVKKNVKFDNKFEFIEDYIN